VVDYILWLSSKINKTTRIALDKVKTNRYLGFVLAMKENSGKIENASQIGL